MAKEVKDVMNEEVISDSDIVAGANAPEVVSPESNDGDIVNVNPWEEESNSNYSREGQETVYANVGIFVYKNINPDASGNEWINLKSLVQKPTRPGAKPFVHEIAFTPGTERGKNKLYMNNLCAEVFGEEKMLPLEVVKRVSTNAQNVRTVSYSARISYKAEDGFVLHCPISALGDGGRATWQNIISILKHSGKIT